MMKTDAAFAITVRLGQLLAILVVLFSLAACRQTNAPVLAPTATLSPSSTLAASSTPTPTISPSSTAINQSTQTASPSPWPSQTASPILTPSATPSPTSAYAVVTALMQAHCRYGPGTAYLHAADLYAGDRGQLWNRNHSGTWLWVRFDKLSYTCWVAASVVEVQGDIMSVSTYFHPLPKSTLYGPPQNAYAVRDGDQVTLYWQPVAMTVDDDRGYLIEARLCQNGYQIDQAFHTNGSSYTVLDEPSCEQPSSARLYTVEKHGYSEPVLVLIP